MSKRVKLIVLGATAVVVGVVAFESLQTIKVLRKPLDTKVLERRQKFIYIDRNYFREPVKDFMTEMFQEETLLHTLLYNVKRKLSFTKVNCCLLIDLLS